MRSWWRWASVLAIWWLAVFLLQRLLFLLFAWRELEAVTWQEFLLCNLHALPLDLSATGYIMLLTSLMMIPVLFSSSAWPARAVRVLTITVLLISAIITAADIGLFSAWGARLDRKALAYLAFPEEAAHSVSIGRFLLLLALVPAQVLLLCWWLLRSERPPGIVQGSMPMRIGSAILLPALCFLAARGGPQDDPINKSRAWFSRHAVLNNAALNGVWNALEIAVEPAQVDHNPYERLPKEEAERLFREHFAHTGAPSPSILKVPRPNILLVLLESWTADVIGPLGGDSAVTPQFARLAKDGLLLTNFFSTGFRTEQGLCALISAFPAQPVTTIMRNYGKFDKLPSVVRSLNDAGYASTYWYGGDVEFANTRAYLNSMGFQRILDENAFTFSKRTDWGAFDEELFAFHLREAHKDQQPFFHLLMTSTSHEPFDAPVNEGFPGTYQPQMYRNTVHYTDRCLGDFMDRARTEDWYANTLVIIVADHGHYLPNFLDHSSEQRHRIPFLLTGGALADSLRGERDGTYASHLDLAATLLAQLSLDASAFEWSRNIFDPAVPHDAFWTFNEGFGMADSAQRVVFDEVGDRFIALRDSTRTADRDRLLRTGQMELQVLLDRYIGFNQ